MKLYYRAPQPVTAEVTKNARNQPVYQQDEEYADQCPDENS